jgi:hypothetical protein
MVRILERMKRSAIDLPGGDMSRGRIEELNVMLEVEGEKRR